MHKRLVNKKVEITTRLFGTQDEGKNIGVIVDTHFDGNCSFIELDSGIIINTLYILSIKLL